jgi:hypothetical protein
VKSLEAMALLEGLALIPAAPVVEKIFKVIDNGTCIFLVMIYNRYFNSAGVRRRI